MTDTERSRIMRAVKSRDTQPEKIVRSLAHRLGYRFRLHRSDLPGKPDLTFAGPRRVIFVHGCFWHGHDCKRGARIPKTNTPYWTAKIARNVARDRVQQSELQRLGWRTMIVWECQLSDQRRLVAQLRRYLQSQ